MLSVNNNFSAAVALQNLNQTNTDLGQVQNRINTGLKVSSAKDNGAIFAIAQEQRARAASLTSIKEGLDRATTAIDTGLAAGQSVSDLLLQLKEKAVAAQARDLSPQQRTAMDNDFQELMKQINTIVNAATFNGANLVNGTNVGAPLNVLTTDIGRSSPTTLVETLRGAQGGTAGARPAASGPLTGSGGTPVVTGDDFAAGDLVTLTVSPDGGAAININVRIEDNMTIAQYINEVNNQAAGAIVARYDEVNGRIEYQAIGANAIDTDDNITIAVADSDGAARTATFLGVGPSASQNNFSGGNTFAVQGIDLRLTATGNINLGGLTTTDALTSADTSAAVAAKIDLAIKNTNAALARLGSQAKGLDAQRTFLTKLQDNVEKGVSSLVDADLAKESSRLQALQVKQQLGAQALSIANQSTQLVLSFFRG
jgi:flagellin